MSIQQPAVFLQSLFQHAVDSVSAARCLPTALPAPPAGRTVVIGAGKAAAAMAQVVEQHWQGELSGVVVTRYGHGADCQRIRVVEAAHPVPDAAGEQAAQDILAAVSGLSSDDLVLCLISGGGSALLALPAPGIQLQDKQQINRALLRSGATIHEMNCVRKHLSAIKGGRLALACAPAKVVTLLISDVPGDDPDIIASGPTLPDASSCADALAILDKYAITVPPHVREHLQSGRGETPWPDDPRFAEHQTRIIATAAMALEAAAAFANAAGIAAHILSDGIEGEARDIGKMHAALALEVARKAQPFSAPCLILSGGETTVTVRGNGRGGRNAEFLLSFAHTVQGNPRIWALACDTDGIDGSEDNAGAVCGPDTLTQAASAGLSARVMLDNNDAYHFFQSVNALITSGPTRTNVNDFRAILVL